MPARPPRPPAPQPHPTAPLRSPLAWNSFPKTIAMSCNVRTLPLHRECSLPRFQGLRHSSPVVRVATLPKSWCGPTPVLPFLEDLVVSRALSCHHARHDLRPAHSVGFALAERAPPAASGLEAIHKPLTVSLPTLQGLPKTVRHTLNDNCGPSHAPDPRIAVRSRAVPKDVCTSFGQYATPKITPETQRRVLRSPGSWHQPPVPETFQSVFGLCGFLNEMLCLVKDFTCVGSASHLAQSGDSTVLRDIVVSVSSTTPLPQSGACLGLHVGPFFLKMCHA